LAIQTADSAESTVILATDPDADRLALAEKDPVTNKWKVFNGNEAGTLLSWWAFKNYKDSHPEFDGELRGLVVFVCVHVAMPMHVKHQCL
jgi:phosphoglucomutase/phosphopentomutase